MHTDAGAIVCVCITTLLTYCTTPSCESSSPEGCDDDDSDLELELQQLQQGAASTSNSGGVLAAANRASGTYYTIHNLHIAVSTMQCSRGSVRSETTKSLIFLGVLRCKLVAAVQAVSTLACVGK
jgi:hypothetical protein